MRDKIYMSHIPEPLNYILFFIMVYIFYFIFIDNGIDIDRAIEKGNESEIEIIQPDKIEKEEVKTRQRSKKQFTALIKNKPHDLDTIYIDFNPDPERFTAFNKKGLKVRLWGADAPEYDENKPDFQQPWGKDGQKWIEKMVLGKKVRFEIVSVSYGRPVCRWFVDDDIDIAYEAVKSGMAWVDSRYVKPGDKLFDALAIAQSKKIGIWSQKNPEAPWDFRQRYKKKKKVDKGLF